MCIFWWIVATAYAILIAVDLLDISDTDEQETDFETP